MKDEEGHTYGLSVETLTFALRMRSPTELFLVASHTGSYYSQIHPTWVLRILYGTKHPCQPSFSHRNTYLGRKLTEFPFSGRITGFYHSLSRAQWSSDDRSSSDHPILQCRHTRQHLRRGYVEIARTANGARHRVFT